MVDIPNINPNIVKNNTPFFEVKNLVDMVNRYALSCTWEQAIQCPCFHDSSPDINCNLCHGQGWIYENPVTLDIALLSDQNKTLGTRDGNFIPLSTIGVPQVTSNGIENGIKPNDRITVNGWDTTQNYIFTLTNQRFKNGIFMPYKINKILKAYTKENNKLVDVSSSLTLNKDTNILTVSDSSLIDKNITLLLSVIKRFYVVGMAKELRYFQISKLDKKKIVTGNGNSYLTYEQLVDNEFPEGVQTFRAFNNLILRRENLYFSDFNVIDNNISEDEQNNYIISDPQMKQINNVLGDE